MAEPGQRNEALRDWDRIIIGIDPGTNVMGYGVLGVKRNKPAMIAMGVIKLSGLRESLSPIGTHI